MATMPCHCTSEFQDAMYGEGMRVYTESKPDASKRVEKRCTVCGGKARKFARLDSHAREWKPVFSLRPSYPWPAVIPAA